MAFDLESSIQKWAKSLQKGNIEPGDQEELISHVRDKCEDLIAEGMAADSAFKKATDELDSQHQELSREYYKSIQKVGHSSFSNMTNPTRKSLLNTNILLHNIRYWFKIVLKNKGQLIQNLFGLVIGVVICTVAFYYANNELNYDGFHEKEDRLFRVRNDVVSVETGEIQNARATSYIAVADALKENIPEVVNATNIYVESAIVIRDENSINISKVLYTTPTLFRMFSIPILAGNIENMDSPNGIFISLDLATRLYGDANPVGQPLRYLGLRLGSEFEFVVQGVYENIPANSYFRNTEAFVPNRVLRDFHTPTLSWAPLTLEQVGWRWSDYITFVELVPGAQPSAVQEKIQTLFNEQRRQFDEKAGRKQVVRVEPVRDIHLVTGLHNELEAGIERDYIHLFFGIGVLVMIVAWVNYVNMSTATSINRAKEIGIKKAMGVFPRQIMGQFMTESVLLTLAALVLSFAIVFIFSGQLSVLLGTTFSIGIKDLPFFAALAAILMAGSLIASFYPAIVLASFRTIDVLKAAVKHGKHGVLIRKGLVVFQFAVVAFLITAMAVAYMQFEFIINRDLGFNIKQKISVDLPQSILRGDNFEPKVNRLVSDVRQMQQVQNIASSSSLPGDPNGWRHTMNVNDSKSEQMVVFGRMSASVDYLSCFDIQLAGGRNFDPNLMSDYSASLIINRAGMNALGYDHPDGIVGKTVAFTGNTSTYNIVGVVEDYHYQSMHSAIEPLSIQLDSVFQGSFLIVEFEGHPREVITQVESLYKEAFPESPFVYDFLDGRFREQYEADMRFQKLFGIFTVVSILLAVMGLLSLSNYFLEQQRKTVSIRKVLGAGNWELSRLLIVEYLVLILIACLVSLPLTYLGVQRWIEGFLYRVDIHPLTYLIPIIILVLIVLGTISKNVLHLIRINPAKILKND